MAVNRNERVMAMVEEAIRENPDVSNEELQERAAEIDPRVGEVSPRSFNARYPLQVKRKLATEEQGGREESAGSEGVREAVREELLRFAKELPRPRTAARLSSWWRT